MSIIIGNPVTLPIDDVTVEPLSVVENGTYTAPEGNAYSPVTVNAPTPEPITVTPLSVTANGTYTAPAGAAYSPVTVDVPSSSEVSKNDVNFYDYDGTVIQNYTAAEFAALTRMPANPSRPKLTAQGWNWRFVDAQAYVARYGKLEIGQMYVTSDGKTRLYIHLEDGRLAPYLGLAINGTATVDWGDGSTSTVTGTSTSTVVNTQHTYMAAGDYMIAIAVSGSMALMGDSDHGSRVLWKDYTGSTTQNNNLVYQNAIQKVEIGANTSIGDYAFQFCYSLASIMIPNDITSIGNYAFNSCYRLASITIPRNVTSIGNYAFSSCELTSVTIPSGVTSIGTNAFNGCGFLTSITIPDSVTSISSSMLQYCSSLTSIIIPSSVTSIDTHAFYGCGSLTSITIPDSVTSIGGSAFSSCGSLTSVTIPSGVTSIGTNAFSFCGKLVSVTIPSGVTSIGSSMFSDCDTFISITIPSGVTSIGANAFSRCYGLSCIKFEPTTPPTISNDNAWTYIPDDCIIYVPSGTLAAYTSAANYPSSRYWTYIEY